MKVRASDLLAMQAMTKYPGRKFRINRISGMNEIELSQQKERFIAYTPDFYPQPFISYDLDGKNANGISLPLGYYEIELTNLCLKTSFLEWDEEGEEFFIENFPSVHQELPEAGISIGIDMTTGTVGVPYGDEYIAVEPEKFMPILEEFVESQKLIPLSEAEKHLLPPKVIFSNERAGNDYVGYLKKIEDEPNFRYVADTGRKFRYIKAYE